MLLSEHKWHSCENNSPVFVVLKLVRTRTADSNNTQLYSSQSLLLLSVLTKAIDKGRYYNKITKDDWIMIRIVRI